RKQRRQVPLDFADADVEGGGDLGDRSAVCQELECRPLAWSYLKHRVLVYSVAALLTALGAVAGNKPFIQVRHDFSTRAETASARSPYRNSDIIAWALPPHVQAAISAAPGAGPFMRTIASCGWLPSPMRSTVPARAGAPGAETVRRLYFVAPARPRPRISVAHVSASGDGDRLMIRTFTPRWPTKCARYRRSTSK